MPSDIPIVKTDQDYQNYIDRISEDSQFVQGLLNDNRELFGDLVAVGFPRSRGSETMIILLSDGRALNYSVGFPSHTLPAWLRPYVTLFKQHYKEFREIDVISIDRAAKVAFLSHRYENYQLISFALEPDGTAQEPEFDSPAEGRALSLIELIKAAKAYRSDPERS